MFQWNAGVISAWRSKESNARSTPPWFLMDFNWFSANLWILGWWYRVCPIFERAARTDRERRTVSPKKTTAFNLTHTVCIIVVSVVSSMPLLCWMLRWLVLVCCFYYELLLLLVAREIFHVELQVKFRVVLKPTLRSAPLFCNYCFDFEPHFWRPVRSKITEVNVGTDETKHKRILDHNVYTIF